MTVDDETAYYIDINTDFQRSGAVNFQGAGVLYEWKDCRQDREAEILHRDCISWVSPGMKTSCEIIPFVLCLMRKDDEHGRKKDASGAGRAGMYSGTESRNVFQTGGCFVAGPALQWIFNTWVLEDTPVFNETMFFSVLTLFGFLMTMILFLMAALGCYYEVSCLIYTVYWCRKGKKVDL